MTDESWQALSQKQKLAHWDESERLLRELVLMLPTPLEDADQQGFEDYLRANELGLAFERVLDAVVASVMPITAEDMHRMSVLAERFGLDGPEWRRGLIVTFD